MAGEALGAAAADRLRTSRISSLPRASGEVPEQEIGATADGAGAELGVGRAWLDVEFRGRSGGVQRSVERP